MSKDDGVQFALKKTVKDLDGLTTTINGEFVDVKKRLDDGGGSIATNDPQEIEAFRRLDALKEGSAEAESKTTGGSAGEEKK